MTPEHAKAVLPFIKAYSEGEKIQEFYDGDWHTTSRPDFQCKPEHYRVAPNPDAVYVILRYGHVVACYDTLAEVLRHAHPIFPYKVVKYTRSTENETR